jgi:hypothetical protein
MARPVDLTTIRTALSELDLIAAEHPELCRPRWIDNLSELKSIVGTPTRERMANYKARYREQGYRNVAVLLSPEAYHALTERLAEHPGASIRDVIEAALLAATPTPTERESDRPFPVDTPVGRDTAIYALHGEGLTLTQIAARLATLGILTANGMLLSGSTIKRVLSYRGLKPN